MVGRQSRVMLLRWIKELPELVFIHIWGRPRGYVMGKHCAAVLRQA
jgi:hypothetical protein